MTPNRDQGWTIAPLAPNVVDPACGQNCRSGAGVLAPRSGRGQGAARRPAAGACRLVGAVPPRCSAVSASRRRTARRSRPRPAAPTAATWIIAGSAPARRCYFPVFRKGAGLSSATAISARATARSSARASRPRSRSSSPSGSARARARLAARRGRRQHVHDRQRPPARSGAAARHDRNAALARRGLRARRRDASHLLGQCVRYDVANVFNPAYSVACRLDRADLAGFTALTNEGRSGVDFPRSA